jgi:hypothetical protein
MHPSILTASLRAVVSALNGREVGPLATQTLPTPR